MCVWSAVRGVGLVDNAGPDGREREEDADDGEDLLTELWDLTDEFKCREDAWTGIRKVLVGVGGLRRSRKSYLE